VTPALVIARKDLRQRIRDRSAIVLSIIAPFGLAAILGSLLPANDDAIETHTYGVVDEDGGPVARSFVTDVLGGFDQDENVHLKEVPSISQARSLARDDEIAAAFVVPAGFSDAIASSGPAELRIIGSPDQQIATQIADAVATSFAAELNAVRLSVATVLAGRGGRPDPGAAQQLAVRASAVPAPVDLHRDEAASKQLDSRTFTAVGMAVFFLFFTAQFGVISLLAERREGTLARLLAAPISPGSIVTAKALSTFVLGTVSMAVLVIASTLLLGADWGDPVLVGALVVAGVVSAMGLTGLVGSLAKTDAQAAGYSSIIAVVLGILGGTFFPLSQAPGLLATLTRVTPHYWLMRGFGDLAGAGATLGDIVPSIIALVGFGAVLGAIALWRARRLVLA
jgi:linearmycin/streptolysin S transport system permease protein